MSVENIGNIGAGFQLFSTLTHVLGAELEHMNLFAHLDGAHDVGAVEYAYHPGSGHDILDHLRTDPVGVSEAHPIDDAYEGSDPNMDVEKDMSPIMQSARAVATEAHFPPAQREAFLQYIQDHRADMTEVKVHNGDVVIMGDGANNGYNAHKFELRLPEDQQDALKGTYEYTDEHGMKRLGTVLVFHDCANPAALVHEDPLVNATPEVAPAPIQHDPEPWRQPMVCSGGVAEYYYGLTLSDKGSYATWEEAAQAYIADSYGHAIPENAPDCIIVRVDENGDGVPEHLFQVDRHSGKVSDFTIEVGGKTIDVSKLPPEEQDLILTGSHDKYQVTVDPTASKSGSMQSTPNPLDTLKLKDGVLYAGGESYAQMADKHMDIFVQDVLQTDTKDTPEGADITSGADGVPGVEHVRQLLSADAQTVMHMSASEIAARFGLTEDQAGNAYDALHRTADRAHSAPEAGESVGDYLYRSFGIMVQSPR
jgi:hypothetical protein